MTSFGQEVKLTLAVVELAASARLSEPWPKSAPARRAASTATEAKILRMTVPGGFRRDLVASDP
jgi:hypothetical protein